MIVRPMLFTDLVAVAELEKACFRDPWNYRMLSSSFTGSGYSGFVLVHEEADGSSQTVGYASMTAVYENGDLDKICVLPVYRKSGGGTLLMQAVLARAKELQVTDLFLEVRISNEKAINLYKKFGFSRISVRSKYYADGEDAAVFRKRITRPE